MKNHIVTYILAVGISLALSFHSAQAGLIVTDGGFETDAAVSDSFTSWYDEAGAAYVSFTWASTQIDATSQVLAFGPGVSYVYQSLGTKAAGEDILSVALDAFERGSVVRGFATLEIDVYAGDFPGAANGTDIDANLTSLDTLTVTSSSLGFTTPSGDDQESVLGHDAGTLDISGVATGTEIWLRLYNDDATTAGGNPTAVYVDNVSVTPIPIPEPTTAVLLLSGLLGLTVLRRKR